MPSIYPPIKCNMCRVRTKDWEGGGMSCGEWGPRTRWVLSQSSSSFLLVKKSPKCDNFFLKRTFFTNSVYYNWKSHQNSSNFFLLGGGRVSPHFCLVATVLMVLYKLCCQLRCNLFWDMLTTSQNWKQKRLKWVRDVNFQKSPIPSPYT
jgi:hypothetical protein